VINRPGNAGWPYCIGPNLPYNDFNFATSTSGAPFDCTGGPTNNSPNNTGLGRLPAAIPAQVYYHGAADPAHFPQLNGGGPIAGPVYRFNPNLNSSRKWPVEMDGKAIFGEWTQNKLFAFQLDSAGTTVTGIDQLLSSMTFLKPMDFKFGPDGALYLIEWGSGFGGDNTDSQSRPDRLPQRRRRPDRQGRREPHQRPGAARGHVLQRRLQRPVRRTDHLLLELRRRHDLHRGQPQPHLRRGQPHRRADGAQQRGRHRHGEPADHLRQHHADRDRHRATRRRALRVR
jgi:hypothetical protein